jgi:hypothetical protein
MKYDIVVTATDAAPPEAACILSMAACPAQSRRTAGADFHTPGGDMANVRGDALPRGSRTADPVSSWVTVCEVFLSTLIAVAPADNPTLATAAARRGRARALPPSDQSCFSPGFCGARSLALPDHRLQGPSPWLGCTDPALSPKEPKGNPFNAS